MRTLIVALLLVYPLSASAQTYEWTDDRGTVNFTEDLGKVPKKFRKKVKVRDDDGGAPQITEEISEPVPSRTRDAGALKQQKPSYGGKDETAWRNEFAAAKSRLQAAERELVELRGRMGDTSKMSRSEYLSIHNTIKYSELRVLDLRGKLELLGQSADQAGVPAELR